MRCLILLCSASALADSSPPQRTWGLLEPRPLEGPFPTLASYCAAQRSALKDPDVKCFLDRPRGECPVRGRGRAVAPFLEVKMISIGFTCDLAIRTPRGWFVHQADWVAGDRDSTEIGAPEVSPSGPGGTPEVLLQVDHTRWWHENDEGMSGWLTCRNSILICGLGPSGVPACTSHLPLEWAEYCEHAEVDDPRPEGSRLPRWKWRMAATLLDGGKLSLRLLAGKVEPSLRRSPLVARSAHETPEALPPGLYSLSWP